MKKKYEVMGVVSGGKFMGIYEAESKEEAEQMALDKEGYVSLCHQCASECEDAQITETFATEIEE
jgi:hypothetical protein